MRMFPSISGHSSEQTAAHYSSRPTVLQLKGVSDPISNWFVNHWSQRTQISIVTNSSFPSKLESSCLQVDRNRKLSTPAILKFKATSKRFGLLGCCNDINDKKRRSSQVWQWRDFPGPIAIATNEIALFCIDNTLRQMASLRSPKWVKAGFHWKIFK